MTGANSEAELWSKIPAVEGNGVPDPNVSSAPRLFTWEEIELCTGQKHPPRDRWLVIDRKVYDIGQFYKKHPGGSRVISHYAGQDATDPFKAFHKDKTLVRKHMKSLLIGELAPDQPSFEHNKNKLLVKEFRELQTTAKKLGLLKPNSLFFIVLLLHILLLRAAGWFVLWYFGTSVMSFLIATVMLTLSMSQAGFLQHDLGHLSVFNNPKLNHVGCEFVAGFLKGLSAKWWSFHHDQHHAKPNCFQKDPDLDIHPVMFSLGETLSRELGKQKKKIMPYNYQHKYFPIMMPIVVVPVFQIYSVYFTFQRRLWRDFVWIMAHFALYLAAFVPLFGLVDAFGFYFLINTLDGAQFTWISQMSHIPMTIDYDKNMDWFSTQLQGTCNVNQSFFNDYITGHLNFQIEHHLFPTMPRHNLWKVSPLVKSLCAKHGIEYQSKPLFTAFADVLKSLKKSGEIWLNAYQNG
ncbi:acyl-CoA (8-3)-desaturase-like isoform X1 [Hemicordylus capensis]|uniref:acyl-CoA (8-3)-desaturase-like isoform X1 n=1 Tax=Hemicordylus capensis TaxID=884348 RepID=UPI0023031D97|nr:acyl-CoA (8-3)-desaturase-like isoform X1 [Hemicordylus capensis]